MARKENMVTERTIDGDRPAKIANDQSDKTTKVNFNSEPFLELLIGLSKKVDLLLTTNMPSQC